MQLYLDMLASKKCLDCCPTTSTQLTHLTWLSEHSYRLQDNSNLEAVQRRHLSTFSHAQHNCLVLLQESMAKCRYTEYIPRSALMLDDASLGDLVTA